MQIDVHAVGIDLPDQCRAYAEYRVFSAVNRFDGNGTVVNVGLTGPPADATYCCVASVELAPGARFRARACAETLYGAIDGAAERLSAAMEASLAMGSSGTTGGAEGGPEPAVLG